MDVINFMSPLASGIDSFKEPIGGKSNAYKSCRFVVAIVLGIIAAWLSFRCNELGPNTGIGGILLQILYTVIAFIFGGIYILYYLLVHWLGDSVLGNAGFASSCPRRQKNDF